jgi:hypothetical protein
MRLSSGQELMLPPSRQETEKAYQQDTICQERRQRQKNTEASQNEAQIKTRILEEISKYKNQGGNPLELYKLLKPHPLKSDGSPILPGA